MALSRSLAARLAGRRCRLSGLSGAWHGRCAALFWNRRARRALLIGLAVLALGRALAPACADVPAPSAAAPIDPTSPLGQWQTFDDKTGKARAVVQIYEANGRLFGRIVQSFTPGAEQRRCKVCSDERKDQPILGLIIIRNLKRSGEEWSGGDILDPDNGSVYRCKLKLDADGRLEVRGYIGFSLLGRTQVWQRWRPTA